MTRLSTPGFLFAILLCFLPHHALAGAGHVQLYSDVTGIDCDLQDPGGLVAVHVYHELHPGDGALGVRLSIPAPAGWIYTGFFSPYVFIGTPTNDISIGYGECLTTRTTIGYAQYFSVQPTAPCTQLLPYPAQGFPSIIAADCSAAEVATFGSGLVINPEDLCCCYCLAARQSTWGAVKALYR